MRRTADDWVRAGARRWLRSGVAAAAGRAGLLGASLAWIGGRCGARTLACLSFYGAGCRLLHLAAQGPGLLPRPLLPWPLVKYLERNS